MTTKFGLDELFASSSDTLKGFSVSLGFAFEAYKSGGVDGGGGREASDVIFSIENEGFWGDGKKMLSSASKGRNFPWSESLSPRTCPLKAGEEIAVEGLLEGFVEWLVDGLEVAWLS
jgi:hypothetical protein